MKDNKTIWIIGAIVVGIIILNSQMNLDFFKFFQDSRSYKETVGKIKLVGEKKIADIKVMSVINNYNCIDYAKAKNFRLHSSVYTLDCSDKVLDIYIDKKEKNVIACEGSGKRVIMTDKEILGLIIEDRYRLINLGDSCKPTIPIPKQNQVISMSCNNYLDKLTKSYTIDWLSTCFEGKCWEVQLAQPLYDSDKNQCIHIMKANYPDAGRTCEVVFSPGVC